ncbi:hypothetical protein J4E85_006505 [Alternaria conjuncta]|uniref:uncharacterized protein n=1 Tax=Alternaria conjuncta TaxID=181017 RepID=UPI00221E824F|nr:uncharacterized protein J4E85_006505 [Alternaria conjuncta]KAI4926213.1 hypothetical protein J4E85_006505 [Alternaria conjuncta]
MSVSQRQHSLGSLNGRSLTPSQRITIANIEDLAKKLDPNYTLNAGVNFVLNSINDKDNDVDVVRHVITLTLPNGTEKQGNQLNYIAKALDDLKERLDDDVLRKERSG